MQPSESAKETTKKRRLLCRLMRNSNKLLMRSKVLTRWIGSFKRLEHAWKLTVATAIPLTI